jgi:hypothetical protein
MSPHPIFSGDTDMATTGLASLTSSTANEIAVFEAEPAEWSDQTGSSIEVRINKLLGRDDLRFVQLIRAEEISYPEGVSFQDFRKLYREPRLIYSCPKCGVGEAVSDRSLTLSEYRDEGGQLTLLGELEFRD